MATLIPDSDIKMYVSPMRLLPSTFICADRKYPDNPGDYDHFVIPSWNDMSVKAKGGIIVSKKCGSNSLTLTPVGSQLMTRGSDGKWNTVDSDTGLTLEEGMTVGFMKYRMKSDGATDGPNEFKTLPLIVEYDKTTVDSTKLLEGEVRQLKNDMSKLEADNLSLQSTARERDDTIGRLKVDKEAIDTSVEELRNTITKLEAEKEAINAAFEQLKNEKSKLETDKLSLQSTARERDDTIGRLKVDKEALDTSIEELRITITRLKTEKETIVTTQQHANEHRIKQLESNVTSLEAQILGLKTENGEAKNLMQSVAATLTESATKLKNNLIPTGVDVNGQGGKTDNNIDNILAELAERSDRLTASLSVDDLVFDIGVGNDEAPAGEGSGSGAQIVPSFLQVIQAGIEAAPTTTYNDGSVVNGPACPDMDTESANKRRRTNPAPPPYFDNGVV
jgi:prefoldin subunit 5